MQEEVTKHTKKIYDTIKKPGHSFGEKAKEIVVEIFIIVFAVTLSIWLHNWSDHSNEHHEANEFLVALKDDLNKDIEQMQENRATLRKVDSNFNYIRSLYEGKQLDTISEVTLSHYFDFEMTVTHSNLGRYEGFKSSGKIGTIANDSIKQTILEYYQQTMPGLNDIEQISNSFQRQILDYELDRTYNEHFRDHVKTFKMQALLQLGTENIEGTIRYYDDAITQAKKLISSISASVH